MVTGIEARVCEDIAARQQLGINKYGTTVEGNPLPLREWLQHAYEEALDMAIYLRRAIEEPQKTKEKYLYMNWQDGENKWFITAAPLQCTKFKFKVEQL